MSLRQRRYPLSHSDYGPAPFIKLKEHLGLGSNLDQKFINKIITNRHYVILNNNNLTKLTKAIESLREDSRKSPRNQREKRASGVALQIAIGLVHNMGINTRFVSTIGGPCTVGVGKVVNVPRKSHIRSYVDIFENNENT